MKEYSIVFPGQGSQYVGMGKNLYTHNSIAREVFDEANDILTFDLKKLCFEGDINELSKMNKVQAAILTTSVAAFRVFIQDIDYEPQYLLGHSLGEITSLVCTGAMNFADALKLVCVRGELMGDPSIEKGIMTAIMGVDEDILREICISVSKPKHIVEISNINSTDQIIISGHENAIDDVVRKIEDLGGRSIRINTGNPFHCSLMNPIKEKLREELLKYKYHDFKYPVISNLDAEIYKGKDEIVDRLSEQIVNSVRWKDSISFLVKQGIYNLVELSPQSVLRNMLLTDDSGIKAYSYDDKYDFNEIKKIKYSITNDLQTSIEIKKEFIQRCVSGIICTKNEMKNEVSLDEYLMVGKMLTSIENDGVEPSYEEMKYALESLIDTMKKKHTNEREYIDRISAVLYKTGLFNLFKEYIA